MLIKPPKGLTKKQMFYWRMKNDFGWYSENFLKIRTKNGTIQKFKLNEPQQRFLNVIEQDIIDGKPRRYIVLKARQMGFSTFTEGKLFHETTTNENTNTLILAHEGTASANLFNMSKMYYELLPEVIQPMIKKNNSKTLTFENPDDEAKRRLPGLRSKFVVATAGTGEVGRSFTATLIHISEMAFFPNAKVTLTGLLQTMPDNPNTMVIIESTANGVGDFFHQEWVRAVKGESDFTPLFFAWYEMSEYSKPFTSEVEKQIFIDEVENVTYDAKGKEVYTEEKYLKDNCNLTYEQLNWRKWCIRNKCHGDIDMFRQEYPSTPEEAFIASGRPKFSIGSLRKYQQKTKRGKKGYIDEAKGVVFRDDEKGYVEIWEEPISGEEYVIGGDVAEGLVEGDYSVGIVMNSNFEIVAKWYGHIDPDLFGDELVKLGKYYNNAYLGVEANNHGLTTIKAVQRKEYHNIYFQKTYDKMNDKITQKIGWTTNLKTKPLMIDKLAQFIREMYIYIPDELIISEAFSYIIEDNGSTNAQQGCHDDTIMATAIALQLALEGRSDNYVPEVASDDAYKKRRVSNVPEIIDPLFEKEENENEISE